jgi:serine/threonine protein kinase
VTHSSERAAEEAPKQIAHFRILGILGRGGMGVVYQAEDTKLRRVVALKRIHADTGRDPSVQKRLLREARAASGLNHPNVVTIHAIEDAEDACYLVMEYIEGEALSSILARGPLDLATTVDLGAQIAEALAAAHAASIVHRDVKPANVIVTASGRVKVLDFGIAKSVVSSHEDPDKTVPQPLTEEGVIVGTPSYMAPEQAQGDPIDARADVFSLGCVLYEMATGARPFERRTALASVLALVREEPAKPSSLRPELPAAFDTLVSAALRKAPVDRTVTAAEVAKRLRSLVAPSTDADEQRPSRGAGSLFVGRRAEMARWIETLESGAGHIFFLAGEAGIGKTRLASAFVEAARSRGQVGVLSSRCFEHEGPGEAYMPILDALRSASESGFRTRLAQALSAHAPTWSSELPGVITTESRRQFKNDTIGATAERMNRELADTLEALAREHPVLLLVDDLQWADTASANLLRHLVNQMPAGVIVVGTYRPSETESPGHPVKRLMLEAVARGAGEVSTLPALSLDEVAQYLAARFADNEFGPELARVLHARTEGHPLFLTTLVDLLLARGTIVTAKSGRARVTCPVSEVVLDVPEGMRSTIEQAIGRLDDDARRTLQYASIQGVEFLSCVAAKLLGVEEFAFDEQVQALRRGHPLVEPVGEAELPNGAVSMRYRFTHGLYQEALYEQVVSSRRALLHRQAGELLQSSLGSSARRSAAKLAAHFERGRDFEKAFHWRLEAAQNAADLNAHLEAIDHCQSALALTQRLEGAARIQATGTVHLRMAGEQLVLGMLPEADRSCQTLLTLARGSKLPFFEWAALSMWGWKHAMAKSGEDAARCASEAMVVAQQIKEPMAIAETTALRAYLALVAGALDQALDLSSEVSAVSRSVGPQRSTAIAGFVRSCVHTWRSEYERSAEEGAAALSLSTALRDPIFSFASAFSWSMALGNMGRLSEPLARLTRLRETLESNRDRHWTGFILNTCAWLRREAQDSARADELDRKCIEYARESGNRDAEVQALLNLAEGSLASGRIDHQSLEEARRLVDGDSWMQWRHRLRLRRVASEALLREGDHGRAAELARELVNAAGAQGSSKYLAMGHLILSEIAAEERDPVAARAAVDQAQAALREKPVVLIDWRFHRATGRAWSVAGDSERARAAYSAAVAAFRRLADGLDDPSMRATMLASPAAMGLQEDAG